MRTSDGGARCEWGIHTTTLKCVQTKHMTTRPIQAVGHANQTGRSAKAAQGQNRDKFQGGMKKMKSKRYLKYIFLIPMILLAIGPGANAQSIVTGGVSGAVSDSSGASVVAAQLTLKNTATGETFSSTSSGSRDYTFALLKPVSDP